MGADSKIEWCDHTFNPWVGCTKVSAACDHCYAESWAKRTGQPHLWSGARRRTTEANWRQPLKWNRTAADAGVRKRVFCASLSDVFDNQVPNDWRNDLWQLILATPHLDWLLLTKRPQNIWKFIAPAWGREGWQNVWLGTTCEDHEQFRARYPHLSKVPARRRFISYEPALGPIRIDWPTLPRSVKPDWIICGGESGAGKRPMDLSWARTLRDRCAQDGIAFFMKQIDKVQPIPDDLLVREFPV